MRPSIRILGVGIQNIEKVGVIGLGLMGHGIVQAAASSRLKRYEVIGLESSNDAMEAGKKKIESSVFRTLNRLISTGNLPENEAESTQKDILSRIKYTTNRSDLSDCDLIIEAITENPEIKLPLYEFLGRESKSTCILASNTSSLKISDMAKASGSADRVVGLHFFNPVQVMKLVEIIRTNDTSNDVFDRCTNFVQSIGKHPVSCKDTPGFIVNRLLVPAMTQAILMYERGDASKEDIDKSMELGAGHPMGPLTLADYIGLDTLLFISKGWVENYPGESAFIIPNTLSDMVKKGKLGRKSGEGFYLWDGDKKIR